MKEIRFPKDFLWGSATSAHQVEGGNINSWTEWESENAKRLAREAKNKYKKWQVEKFPEMLTPNNYVSGIACDHYNRFEYDFDIARELGHNAHRFSIEWSRIEPKKGEFDKNEIMHYRKVIQSLRNRGIKPFVTLWHWTNPVWLKNGELDKNFPIYFSRYVRFVVKELGDLVDFWITINEPTSVIANSYIIGIWPPQKRNFLLALRVYKNLANSHKLSFDVIHKLYPESQVGFANILSFNEPYDQKNFLDKILTKIFNYFSNEKFLKMTEGKNDFLTVQYYFHNKIKFIKDNDKKRNVSDLDWEIYPEGIYHILKNLKKYNLPIYITENGLADKSDSQRENFIKKHLYWIHRAINEGVNVQGYFYWSLLDNFEWNKGFWPRFGLVEINYKTLERKIRPSARIYAEICRNGKFKI